MKPLTRRRSVRLKDSISGWLLKPFELLMSLLDIIFLPLQRLLGVRRMAYFFLTPNMVIFGVFILLPMLLNFYYGFTSGHSILLKNREYVGTENLDNILTCEDYSNPNTCNEDYFWRGVRNTAQYVSVQVISMVILALVTALALNRKIRLRGFFRSVFFYPVLLSPVVVALIWKWFLRYDNGLLNSLLVEAGYDRVQFLANGNWARFWVIVVNDWAQMGFYTLILLAGLQAIPGSLYEAAEIDGAGRGQRFRKITIPMLSPTIFFNLVMSIIGSFQTFDSAFVISTARAGAIGSPLKSTLFYMLYLYESAFSYLKMGYASAMAWLLFAVIMLVTFVVNRSSKRWVFYGD